MKLTKFFAFAFAAFAVAACEPIEKPQGGGDDPKPTPTGDITLTADKTAVAIGEEITFTVTDAENQDVTSQANIYDGDFNEVGSKVTLNESGSYSFFATLGSKNSNYVTIVVMASVPEVPEDEQPENFVFNHRALVIDQTGVNCGYCPQATEQLKALENTEWHKYYNEVTCHAGSYAGGDPGNSAAANALNQFQSGMISGYPCILVNFYTETESYAKKYIVTALQNNIKQDGADVGISLSVDKGTNAVSCSAQIKAAVSAEYKVNAWLLENNIYSPNQSNATKDYHYYYNHALRKTSESVSSADFSGKSIGMLYIGETYNYNCTIPVDSSWEMNNLEVLIVVTARNGSGSWDVVNTAVCGVGEETPFAYI